MTTRKKCGWIMLAALVAIIAGTLNVRALGVQEADAIIRRAYNDYLGRDPDPQGLKHYRHLILDEGWSEEHVRKTLRRSPEADQDESDIIVKRAYREILGRDPDPAGMQMYRNHLLHDGWSVDDVRKDLKKSEEYRTVRVDAIITKAYKDVLGRKPDPDGLINYRKAILEEGWTEEDVRHQLRKSPEYKERSR
jgi:hypothetical protein